ncbi:hypothetical protein JTE90_016658 [Oedothorax gibbosus]|uniref:VWFC domain-containing protein n=1 Tax=Oedothorax gibbosus TaxID=931172 RepID=A0AAV6V374_9ARAC|nr:hypothetical protein JTE90_016658 [Oedothorax gibbosus]
MKGFGLTLVAVLIQLSWIAAKECDLRFFEHYEHKGCKPVLGEDGCPTRFQCEPLSNELRLKCLHNSKLYNLGELIDQKCEHCTCRGDQLRGAEIECADTDCPDWEPKDKSCYMGYKLGACCPTEMCPSGDGDQQKTCNYNGKSYKIGQIIRTENPCESCVCSEDWTGSQGKGCSKVNCLTGLYASEIRRGCLPVYRKNTCCAIDIHCGSVQGSSPVTNPSKNTDELCHYQEKFYEKGSKVYPTKDSGVECTCSVPPDFTCLRTQYN